MIKGYEKLPVFPINELWKNGFRRINRLETSTVAIGKLPVPVVRLERMAATGEMICEFGEGGALAAGWIECSNG